MVIVKLLAGLKDDFFRHAKTALHLFELDVHFNEDRFILNYKNSDVLYILEMQHLEGLYLLQQHLLIW